jgi:hypothetical protein
MPSPEEKGEGHGSGEDPDCPGQACGAYIFAGAASLNGNAPLAD